ncbi:hypothetical protein BD410DRAFT_785647 [Rickenella mellea]|uniref:Uncharacterized protein n=1 Tax=Rickenella mellea TaxID=50990 RepID=A0A4Y7QBE5_9AGAM|nr:hypothetical protein BD410DRAFT_785647 [Rickenella mellea]
MNTVPVAPSPFAALLRRSKFASWDPNIGQLYTTYGGHAHRGDWGLKRSIAKRHRNSCIKIQSIDTRFQQTEWERASHESHWMKKWSEMERDPDVSPYHQWGKTTGVQGGCGPIDSDFEIQPPQMQKLLVDDAIGQPVPNVYAMGERELRHYVDRIRKTRPEFKQFVEGEKLKEREKDLKSSEKYKLDYPLTDTQVDLFADAQNGASSDHLRFMAQRTRQKVEDPTSTTLVQVPHKNAGLSYTHSPRLQDIFLSKPLPGRIVANKAGGLASRSSGNVAAVGGFAGEISRAQSDGVQALQLGVEDATTGLKTDLGKGVFRVSRVLLEKAPRVVGPVPESLYDEGATKVKMTFRGWATANSRRENGHWPGSRAYVAQDLRQNFLPLPSVPRKNRDNLGLPKPVDGRVASNILDQLSQVLALNGRRRRGDDKL